MAILQPVDTTAQDFVPAPNRKLIRLPLHLNDPAFAIALAASFREIETKEGQAAWPASRVTRS